MCQSIAKSVAISVKRVLKGSRQPSCKGEKTTRMKNCPESGSLNCADSSILHWLLDKQVATAATTPGLSEHFRVRTNIGIV